ncbi:MAG TPA: hypothetical protein DCS11_03170 [Syntrophus sp. (in: bacteria)]|nr:hypothetical protein [Syntrophus sp. (in: bacteria)]
MTTAGGAVVWDVHRLDRDFKLLFSLLGQARLDAFYRDTTVIVAFGDRIVTVSDDKGSRRVAAIPSLSDVDYDTTLGDDRIVYTWRGTAHHNRREHGGEILLKSLLGFKRYLHVNCNGLVRDGKYPRDAGRGKTG